MDDEARHRDLTAYMLGQQYNIISANNAESALAIACHETIDVALVDYRMPGATGTTLLATFKDKWPNCIRFLVTAYSEEKLFKEAINLANVYRFVAKPINFSSLEIDIQHALENRQADEQMRQAQRMLMAATLANIAVHDMRNSLQGLMLLPTLLDSGKPEDLELAKSTLQWAQSTLNNCINEVLTVLKGGKPEYTMVVGSLEPILKQSVALYRRMYPEHLLTLSLAANLPKIPLCEKHVYRMFGNLISNAAQATPQGGTIAVTATLRDGYVSVEVRDNGQGIPEKHQPHLFEAMYSTKGKDGVGFKP